MRVLLAILFAVGASADGHCTANHKGYMHEDTDLVAGTGPDIDCCWTAAVEAVAASCSVSTCGVGNDEACATSEDCVAEDEGDATCAADGTADEDAATDNQCKATWNAGNDGGSDAGVGPAPNVNCWNPFNLCAVAGADFTGTADDCAALGNAFFTVFLKFLADDAACAADAAGDRRLAEEEETDDEANDYDCYTEAFTPWVAACETYIVGLEDNMTEEQRKTALTTIIGQTDSDKWYAAKECAGAVASFQEWGWSTVSADDVKAVTAAVKAAGADEEEEAEDASSAAALTAAVGLVALLF